MKRIIDILKNPGETVKLAKKEGDMGKTVVIMIEEWAIAAIGFMIFFARFGSYGYGLGLGILFGMAFGVFIMGIVGTMILGFLLKIGMNTLGGRGNFFGGLSTIVYSFVPLMIGLFIAATMVYLPIAGMLITFLVMATLGVISAALLYRGAKEMFSTDMVTTMVGISVFMLGFFVALYTSIIFGLLGIGMSGFGSLSGVVL